MVIGVSLEKNRIGAAAAGANPVEPPPLYDESAGKMVTAMVRSVQ
jgi:hypothetical protein